MSTRYVGCYMAVDVVVFGGSGFIG